ncbi:MAG: hypothetical protein LBQ49_03095 [Rickettsiales bacterium]|jgi:hypothetical protein|nr:hypothetical protein [Rickettsiales bacterium]
MSKPVKTSKAVQKKAPVKKIKKAASAARGAKEPAPKITDVLKEVCGTYLNIFGSRPFVDRYAHHRFYELKVRSPHMPPWPAMVCFGEQEIYIVKGAYAPSMQLVNIDPQPYLLFERRTKAEYNEAVEEFHHLMRGREHTVPEFLPIKKDVHDHDDGYTPAAYIFINDLSNRYDPRKPKKYPRIVSEKYLAEYLLDLVRRGFVHTDARLFDATAHEVVVNPKTNEPACVADYVAPLWPKAAAKKKSANSK